MVLPAGARGRSCNCHDVPPERGYLPRTGRGGLSPRERNPGLRANNALLVVEIADNSLVYDMGRKAALYASFGVRELWVIDAVRLTTRVFREPASDGYRDARDFTASDRLVPLVAPEAFALRLDELEIE
jgi:Uma2 family endonuclease